MKKPRMWSAVILQRVTSSCLVLVVSVLLQLVVSRRIALATSVVLILAYDATNDLASAAPATDAESPVAVLQTLGKAYAKDTGATLDRVEAVVATTITAANSAEWDGRLEETLAVGYAPKKGALRSIRLADLKDLMKIKMAGQRTPVQVVKAVVTPGNVIMQVTWHFAGGDPVKSHAVFSSKGELQFDTFLSLPVIVGSVFSPHHF